MSPIIYLVLGAVSTVLVVGAAVSIVVRKRRALPPAESRPRLEDDGTRPSVEPARKTLTRPVEDTEGLSLRELKAARGAKLSESYKSSEDARAEREYRKGAQAAPLHDGPLAQEEGKDAPTSPAPRVRSEQPTEISEESASDDVAAESAPAESARAVSAPASLEGGLARTRDAGFIGRLSRVFRGRETLDEDLVEDIEEVLFTADIGTTMSQYLLESIEDAIGRGDASVEEVWRLLRAETEKVLSENTQSLEIGAQRPWVILFVGVNGVGKTTTIGKLAARYQAEGKKVMMIAGDTFRAAAVQQLEAWSQRVDCGFYRGDDNADPSSVIYGGIEQAREKGYDIVLADTAGRLHTRAPLVDELKKIARASGKAADGAPHQTVLVLDANTGQNAIQQARMFHEAVPIDGLVLTKLDGTAKGGIILGIARELSLPVYFIGIGEGIRDLRPFDAAEFVDALF